MKSEERSFYRFRPASALLGKHKEIEEQVIYFASPAELNDPLDGFKNVCWKGDEILWNGLLKHYVHCLCQAAARAKTATTAAALIDADAVLSTPSSILPRELEEFYRRAWANFSVHPDVAILPGLLASRRGVVRRNEMIVLLRMLHFHAANSVMDAAEQLHYMPARSPDQELRRASNEPLPIIEYLRAMLVQERDNPEAIKLVEVASLAGETMAAETNLLLALREQSSAGLPGWRWFVFDFPPAYVSALDSVLFSNYYVASFVADAHNAAMWGVYGDGNTGAALIFKSQPDATGNRSLSLEHLTGVGSTGPLLSWALHSFQKVEYSSPFPEIDFFRCLGMLTGPMLDFWARNEAGRGSPIIADLLRGDATWRESYWRTFDKSVTTKLPAWGHEGEYRLTLHGGSDFAPKDNRRVKFRFEDLKGIIFGLKMETDDKKAILRLIEAKCRITGRTDFEFYQAVYSSATNRIEHTPLNRLWKEIGLRGGYAS